MRFTSASGAAALFALASANSCLAAPTPDATSGAVDVATQPIESRSRKLTEHISQSLPWLGGAAGAASAVFNTMRDEVSHAVTWRLVQTSAEEQPYWTTELGKHLLLMRGINYMDVTEHHADYPVVSLASTASSPALARSWPSKLSHGSFLTSKVFANISDAGPRSTLETFTAFKNRYYRSQTGRGSQLWLFNKVKKMTKGVPSIQVREFEHSWAQNSIILHWPSTGKKASVALEKGKKRPVIVLGAHLDSTAFIPFLPAPGGDDDGSGTATIVEALRSLIASGWQPEGDYDLEWMWYSAEEGGLLGSQEVVKSYVNEGREVRAMMQQDMTAFLKPGTEEKIALVSDFTDPTLTSFLELLVKEYLTIPSAQTKIGYAASDHASWMKAGIPAAFAVEGLYDDCNLRNIHTGGDTTTAEGYSFDHMLHFVRLTTAFVVELAGQTA